MHIVGVRSRKGTLLKDCILFSQRDNNNCCNELALLDCCHPSLLDSPSFLFFDPSTQCAVLIATNALRFPPLAQRLVVGLGCSPSSSSELTRGNLGRIVAQRLLSNCSVPPTSVHDSKGPRSPFRNANGLNKRTTFFTEGAKRKRHHETWDSEPFRDFDGVWCDRLLLGDPSVRTALLAPHGDALGCLQSLERVLRSQRQIRSEMILLVQATEHLPVGSVMLAMLGNPNAESLFAGSNTVLNAASAIEGVTGNASESYCCWIGVGDAEPLLSLLLPAAEEALQAVAVPLAAFSCALWASSPSNAETFLAQRKWKALSDARRRELFQTLQTSMVSVRDENVLRAYRDGHCLSPRMNENRVRVQAEKLLFSAQCEPRRGTGT